MCTLILPELPNDALTVWQYKIHSILGDYTQRCVSDINTHDLITTSIAVVTKSGQNWRLLHH